MTRTQRIVVALFFGAAFALNGILRGDVAPGLVGGALGGVLVYIVIQRVTEHHAALRRQRERQRDDR